MAQMPNTKLMVATFNMTHESPPILASILIILNTSVNCLFQKKTHIFLCIPKIIPQKITFFQVLAFFSASQKNHSLKKSSTIHHAPLENLILHLWMPNLHGPKHHEDHYPYYEHDPRDLKRCYVGHHLRFQPASTSFIPNQTAKEKRRFLDAFGSTSFGKCVDQACKKW